MTGTPQQVNGHDCGAYLLAVAAALCGCAAAAAAGGEGAGGSAGAADVALLPLRETPALAAVTPQAVRDLRRRMRHAIELLAEASKS